MLRMIKAGEKSEGPKKRKMNLNFSLCFSINESPCIFCLPCASREFQSLDVWKENLEEKAAQLQSNFQALFCVPATCLFQSWVTLMLSSSGTVEIDVGSADIYNFPFVLSCGGFHASHDPHTFHRSC